MVCLSFLATHILAPAPMYVSNVTYTYDAHPLFRLVKEDRALRMDLGGAGIDTLTGMSIIIHQKANQASDDVIFEPDLESL